MIRPRFPLLTAALAVVLVVILPAQQAGTRRVVMITVDGLMPSTYTQSGGSKVPTLRRLMREGAYAESVTGVLPTVTYPSHTTMITGVLPALHGIYNNRILDPEETSNGSWYWYARDIKVPTLFSAAKARGLSTAAVSWPVTVDADIDYNMPEFGGVTPHPKWLDLIRAVSRPHGMLDQYEAQERPIGWPMTDADRTGLAAWIIKTYRPHLMLLHIFGTDDAQHQKGPGSPEALAAIETADGNIQTILDAVAAAGLQRETDVVVLSDHGFLPIARQLQPNFAFKRAGLLDVDAAGKVKRWDAYFYGAGGSGFVLLKNPDDAAVHARVAGILKELAAEAANGVQTVWTREELRAMGAEPRASFGIDMREGFYSANGHDVLVKPTASKGGHGFAPTRPALYASLVMHGPDVGTAGNLHAVRMSQIGPTVASWLGLTLSPQADAPIPLRR